MNKQKAYKVLRWVRSHGVTAHIVNKAVEFSDNGTTHRVYSFYEAKQALGV